MNNIVLGGSKFLAQFCTPPVTAVQENEKKSLREAEKYQVTLNGEAIKCYAFGEGPAVLLCHGWGSRAAHLAPMARIISRRGFRTILLDAPAHSSMEEKPAKDMSSMFEYASAISAVCGETDDVHAIIGHSLGAMATLFSIAQFPRMDMYNINSRRLVLISAPANFELVVDSFCNHHGLDTKSKSELFNGLQNSFEMSIADYDCKKAVDRLSIPHMIVQDETDEYFPPEHTLLTVPERTDRELLQTSGFGHDRILMSRDTARAICEFLE